jgi:hypothetical protein
MCYPRVLWDWMFDLRQIIDNNVDYHAKNSQQGWSRRLTASYSQTRISREKSLKKAKWMSGSRTGIMTSKR